MAIPATIGNVVNLELNLADGNETAYPQALVYLAGASSPQATVSLVHTDKGIYHGTWTPSVTGVYVALFITYADAQHSIESLVYSRVSEQIIATQQDVDDLAALVVRAMGLLHENAFIDDTVYSGGHLISARLRVFNSKANAEAATDGGSETAGLNATYNIVSDLESSGKMKTYRMVRSS